MRAMLARPWPLPEDTGVALRRVRPAGAGGRTSPADVHRAATVRIQPVSTTRCPASSMRDRQPRELLTGQDRPAPPGRASRSAGAPRRPADAGRPRRRAAAAAAPARPASARGARAGRPARRPRPRSSRQVPPAPCGPGPGHVDPDPDDHARRGRRCPAENSASASTPASFACRADQQVVGPLQHRLHAGHLRTGVRPRQRHRRRAQVHSVPPHAGRSRTEASRFAPGGDSQRRSSRPRPAVWWSATTTRPSGAPWRARSRTYVLVESTSSSQRMSHSPPHMADTIRRVQL